MSFEKCCCVSRIQPDFTIVTGSARKVFDTNPPSVANAHTAKKSTKNKTPRTLRRPGLISRSGFKRGFPAARKRLLQEAGVGQGGQVGNLLDGADLEQQVSRFLGELLMLAAEEFLV